MSCVGPPVFEKSNSTHVPHDAYQNAGVVWKATGNMGFQEVQQQQFQPSQTQGFQSMPQPQMTTFSGQQPINFQGNNTGMMPQFVQYQPQGGEGGLVMNGNTPIQGQNEYGAMPNQQQFIMGPAQQISVPCGFVSVQSPQGGIYLVPASQLSQQQNMPQQNQQQQAQIYAPQMILTSSPTGQVVLQQQGQQFVPQQFAQMMPVAEQKFNNLSEHDSHHSGSSSGAPSTRKGHEGSETQMLKRKLNDFDQKEKTVWARWIARVWHDGRIVHLGSFVLEDEAGRVVTEWLRANTLSPPRSLSSDEEGEF
ncbi:Hypothetical Protein FCC1311_078462 [Hondaea fermentalgiana]|uniref:Uncharacterized protein n=1 Tax=Hondaea fermentalgiana TaxID=2315210 RepID=A0A2R5GTA6_9STRA|nr:Hypothetical Protein FCC1311_078462 [Hondaea fermentalgiana]|eukprot:GBG31621.1 Hypothetical Protein FCC1311_078462 [Hondaea fermentalgiana]